ncbi:MAG: PAS domain S-box protein [Proteobacteria bacterium]|nr:PAS domain S-box protein [Pseudomonadota bacterium]MBU1648055.1 PAS domain S-box protein [Pseudomonadota bacterium]
MNTLPTLRQRLRNLLFLVAFASFLLSAGIVGWLQFQAYLDNYARIMHAQLRVIQSLIPAKLLQYNTSLRQMIKTLPEGDDQRLLAALRQRLHNYDPLDIYYVLDARGQIVQISEEYNNYLGFDPSHMEHVQEAMMISRVFQSVFSKRSVVALQYPLKNGMRLIYERALENLVPMLVYLEKGNVFAEQSFFILSSEGVAVYYSDPSLVSSRYNLLFDLKNMSVPDKRGLQSYLYHNQKYYALRETLKVPEGWTVYLHIPARLLSTAILTSISFQLAGVFILFVLITLLLQYLLNRFFSRPVNRIVNSLTAYESNRNEPVFADIHSFGVVEFALVAEAINHMNQAVIEANVTLASSEEQIRLLLNSTAEAIYGLDLEGRCTFCNDSFLRIMGFTNKKELLGKIIHDIIHHSNSDGSRCHFSTCVAHQGYRLGQEAHSDHEVFWRADGNSFHAECWSYPIRKEGELTGAVVTFLDITERKQAEAEKNAAIARFSTLVDSLDALVYVADMETYELLFVNQYGREIWGDIVGKVCWQTLQSGQKGPCPFCTNHRLLDGAGRPTGTYLWELQNTVSGCWYECRDQAIPWSDGRMVRMEIAIDISQRKEGENALAAEKEQLAVTLHSIGDGVITTDIEGRIVLVNTVAEKLTGWSQREAQGRHLTEVFTIINEKTRQPCENPVDKVLASGQIIGMTNHTVLVAKDGQERNIADSGAPIRNQQSRTIGVVLVFRDVSEQIRMEDERLKIRKLESVGVLAGGIAHDFNNILAAIMGNLSLAQLDSRLEEETRKLLRAAEKASLRARDLTQQLLTFSKGGEPVKETASIGEIIKESADFVLHGSPVYCRYVIPDDLWLVDIDKGQMSQVIHNIILNARHAMPEGGSIEVRCENVEGLADKRGFLPDTGRAVKITISDTGIGIPAALLDKIFDPYFSTKQEGSGLGLAITHSIISKHGGHISVESTPGQGTTFTLLLPASAKGRSVVRGADATMVAIEGGNARIMIMDDEEIVRTVVSAMLTHLGYEVVEAGDGKEALSLYRSYREEGRPINFVIMDLTIPGGMGGKEAVQELLALDPTAKVIVSSGYSNDPIMANCRHYGFSAAVVKPFQVEDIVRVLQQVSSSSEPLMDEKGV